MFIIAIVVPVVVAFETSKMYCTWFVMSLR
jgi:hypothetical protein